MTGEGSDVIVIIWYGCVSLGVVIAISTVKREDVAPVMKGSINDTGEEPLCPKLPVSCHGCSLAKKSNLMFMFPSALKRFRRHLLSIPAGSYVCCMLQGSSDGSL